MPVRSSDLEHIFTRSIDPENEAKKNYIKMIFKLKRLQAEKILKKISQKRHRLPAVFFLGVLSALTHN